MARAIEAPHTPCKDEFRRNPRSHSEIAFPSLGVVKRAKPNHKQAATGVTVGAAVAFAVSNVYAPSLRTARQSTACHATRLFRPLNASCFDSSDKSKASTDTKYDISDDLTVVVCRIGIFIITTSYDYCPNKCTCACVLLSYRVRVRVRVRANPSVLSLMRRHITSAYVEPVLL